MDRNDDIMMDGIDERIEAFLRGSMSAEEEASFKQEVRENPELRNHVRAMTGLIRGLQAQNTAKEKAIIQENTAKSKVRPILWWACSIAAVFAFSFGIYKDRRHKMLNSVVSPYYAQYDMSDTFRGEADSVAITHLYTLFSQIQKSNNVSDIIKELEPIYFSLDDDFTYHLWANDIAWNLALAYTKDDQIDKAVSVLEKIKEDNPETPLYNKADELFKKLSDL